MRFHVMLLFLLISFTAYAGEWNAYINDARSSFLREDHLHAARLFESVLENQPNLLEAEDIEKYLISKSLLLPLDNFISLCKQRVSSGYKQVEFNFYCAKNLIDQNIGSEAVAFLDAVPANYHRLEFHLLKASAFLMQGKSTFCIEEIKNAQKKITANTSLHFKDLIQVTEARCLVDMQKYDEALVKFQNVQVESDFYLSTLEEQAWVQFKRRNLKASRDILNIIHLKVSSLQSTNSIYDDMFFRVKYLQGYIDLITNNSESAKIIFQKITNDILKYKKENLRTLQVAFGLVKSLDSIKSKADFQNKKLYQKFFNRTIGWISQALVSEADRGLRVLIALNLELNRKEFLSTEYVQKIEELKRKHMNYLADVYKESFNDYKRSLDSIHFKSNMGQIENIWAQRTEGKRTIAEALDAYNKDLSGVEEYLER